MDLIIVSALTAMLGVTMRGIALAGCANTPKRRLMIEATCDL
jgi:hypothetical protein